MTAFLILAVLLTAAALYWVLVPLVRGRRVAAGESGAAAANVAVYRDQLRELEADLASGLMSADQYDQARRELEARLLEDVALESAPRPPAAAPARGTVFALALAVPLSAIVLYLAVGAPGTLDPRQMAAAGGMQGMHAHDFEVLVDRLAARLKEEPEDGEGWLMLGRSYNLFGRYADAAQAYANAVKRLPPDASLLADYADALAMAQGRRLEGEPEKLIARALAIDPNNVKALALAGSAAFERRDYAEAARYWERMVPLVPPDSDEARTLRANIEEARTLAASTIPGRGPARVVPTVAKPGITGVVKLAPELAGKTAPDDVLFIFARPKDGSRMPIAIQRRKAGELPAEFVLDDVSAMAPGMSLSSYAEVVIGARISKSASATPRPGDLEGVSAPVRNDARGVAVVIDSVVR
jgi:cytochrome c-type biogenesis protein CcmH